MKTPPPGKLLLWLLTFILCPTVTAQVTPEILSIKKNYTNAILGKDKGRKPLIDLLSALPPEKEVSDQNVIEQQQLNPITTPEIQTLIRTIRTDGSWPDINYADTKRSGWEPKIHTERILKLTKYYYQDKQSRKSVSAAEIISTIRQAMNFWFTQKLVCKNWWYNQIGIPRTLGPAFLLFEAEMNQQEKQNAIEVMMNSKFGMTGQNKVWLAGNVLIRGLLQNDWQMVKQARDIICSEIVLGQEEGIKEDWSFHQHGPQQQFGNYGLSFICNMSFYSELFAGTPLALTSEQQQILTSLLLKGYQWIVWRGYLDVNCLNRQLFRNADLDKPFRLLFAAYSLMKSSDKEDAKKIQTFIDQNFFSNQVPNAFIGNKHFQESDLTIHRTPQWMASLRMASDRVIGTELVNEDNLKGYYMADGALYTYARGDEYHNIFPFWDWRRIPGITTYESNAPIPNANRKDSRNQSSYVGGASDGETGITAMVLNRNKLTAHKAWIFTDDYILCMGSDIHADSTATILTSIDQRFAKEPFWSLDNKRFFHDHTGYIVLQADTCIAVMEKKQGQWSEFMGMYKPLSLENNIFSLYLKHRKDIPASYIYLILPACTQKQVEAFDMNNVQILRNDSQMQAAKIGSNIYLVAYKEAKIDIGTAKIHIAQPGTYIVQASSGKMKVLTPFRKSAKKEEDK